MTSSNVCSVKYVRLYHSQIAISSNIEAQTHKLSGLCGKHATFTIHDVTMVHEEEHRTNVVLTSTRCVQRVVHVELEGHHTVQTVAVTYNHAIIQCRL